MCPVDKFREAADSANPSPPNQGSKPMNSNGIMDYWIVGVITAMAGIVIAVLGLILPMHRPLGFALTGIAMVLLGAGLMVGNIVSRKQPD
jgi:hypothetical protein